MKIIIPNFKPESGWHCVSNSMKMLFHHSGIDISEEMIFGLSSALNFIYFEFKFSPVPFIGGRNKIGEFEENLAKSLNITINIYETASNKKAFAEIKKLLESGIPVMLYVDMAYLPYLKLPEGYHFGGHAIVMYGIDEDEGTAYVSDRDGNDFKVTMRDDEEPADFHIISLDMLEKARGSNEKPFPPKNRWLTFDFSTIREIDRDVIFPAINLNAEAMLNPPIKNLGISGIELFSHKILDWNNFNDDKLKIACINGYVMISKVGGSGGANFRKMYGNFLSESGKITNENFLTEAGESYLKIAEHWDFVGDTLFRIFETGDKSLLVEVSKKLEIITIREKEITERLKEFVNKI